MQTPGSEPLYWRIWPYSRCRCDHLVHFFPAHSTGAGALTVRSTGGIQGHGPLLYPVPRGFRLRSQLRRTISIAGRVFYCAVPYNDLFMRTVPGLYHLILITTGFPHIMAACVGDMGGTNGICCRVHAPCAAQVFKNVSVTLRLIIGLDHLQVMPQRRCEPGGVRTAANAASIAIISGCGTGRRYRRLYKAVVPRLCVIRTIAVSTHRTGVLRITGLRISGRHHLALILMRCCRDKDFIALLATGTHIFDYACLYTSGWRFANLYIAMTCCRYRLALLQQKAQSTQ